jgi:hypothetical protein
MPVRREDRHLGFAVSPPRNLASEDGFLTHPVWIGESADEFRFANVTCPQVRSIPLQKGPCGDTCQQGPNGRGCWTDCTIPVEENFRPRCSGLACAILRVLADRQVESLFARISATASDAGLFYVSAGSRPRRQARGRLWAFHRRRNFPSPEQS